MIYEEERTVRLTVDQITLIIMALDMYEADAKERGLTYTAEELGELSRSFLRVNLRAYGQAEIEGKEIEVK